MTIKEEIRKRLALGDSPVSISVDVWTRKLQDLETGVPIKDIRFGTDACALCMSVGYDGLERSRCEDECPYYAYYTVPCFIDYPYNEVEKVYPIRENHRDLLIIVAEAMIKKLDKLADHA